MGFYKTMFTILALPNNFVASTTETMSQLFTDLSPITILIMGILLVAVLLSILIGTLKG